MKLMRGGQEVRPEDMTKDELERLGKWLAKMDADDKHACKSPDHCQPFAGTRCGVVGKDIHRIREIWREKNARGWRTEAEIEAARATRTAPDTKKLPERAEGPVSRTRRPTTKGKLFQNIEEGYYGLLDDQGKLTVYKVDVPVKGRWKDYRFIRRFDSGDLKYHRVTELDEALALLKRISDDVQTAKQNYARRDQYTL